MPKIYKHTKNILRLRKGEKRSLWIMYKAMEIICLLRSTKLRRTHANQVVCNSHVSPMPFDFRLWTPSWCGDKCLDIMLPSVGGMVTSPCSAENRSQAQISNSLLPCKTSVQEVNFTDFVRCFPVGGQHSLFFSEGSEVVLIYLIKYK